METIFILTKNNILAGFCMNDSVKCLSFFKKFRRQSMCGRNVARESEWQRERETEKKQAMITLRGMAEKRFSNVYNYKHFTLLWYIYRCFSPPPTSIPPFYPLPFYDKWNKIKCDISILNRWKKVNNNDDSLDHLYKCKFVFWHKQK